MSQARSLVVAMALALGLLASGCGGGNGGNYVRSAYGTEGGYSFKNVHAKPANLMVARKVERPLYIVLDPSRVRDTWQIATPSCEVHGQGCEHFKLVDV